ncbi:hypothetical protein [Aeromonas hydrophila]|uniref:hypothetical protein n=1 Tax=Aeromonas hydrophila TaxID=644 RepID=UPI001A8F62DA|nr:hypothetical protein [Aeromonas hydrophila]MBQ4668215.1 hypothetical protein [Aeromonas hydrophila]MBQ4716248.1 hypothetical protein [Aeromonas hydrophila]MBW3825037.1 hypothetical protein [Aeromonas hydrophila]MBW5269821.1 hypothetical protein [Aeromonas hydrophila]QSR53167.1 hypothetical protein GO458_18085 [Aeromonas hydrophila]
MKDIREFLKYVNICELNEKINSFRELDFKKLDYKEIQDAILNVISFDTPQGKRSVLPTATTSYIKGTRFFRVRHIDNNYTRLPLKSMSTVADCWEAPSDFVKAGRLNRDNESLLYTSPIYPAVAVEEMKIEEGKFFSLIVYEAIESINATCIGFGPEINGLSENEALKLKMLQYFLKHEFTRDVGKGTEFLYRISESIVKDYFDLPSEVQDAWSYPSVAKKGGYNTCFRPSTKRKLKLIGVQIASLTYGNDDYLFKVWKVAKDSGNGIDLTYYDIGSLEQKSIFPEINIINTSHVIPE